QLLLVDTPGMHESSKRLNVALNEAVQEASQDCDVAVLVVDAVRGWEPAHEQLFVRLIERGIPTLVALNKIDRLKDAKVPSFQWPHAEHPLVFGLSARTGAGVEVLLQEIEARLPESPPLYPEDHLTDRPVRWLCGELVREVAFEVLEQELPYSIAVDVVQYADHPRGGVAIHANLLVARESQKRIVVGAGGRTIRAVGTQARHRIERFLGERAHLNLFVKVDPRWLENARRIEALGYR
ncbi:MAG: GTPase Era, partial [Myxococcota bacterium]|nr:GTPase Era [Myxococcota bacterium]